ncbi:ATP-dependent zinc protease family protein [Glaciecola petra]|uniref:RimK/LysX family protein n=1 Tax=Glaciecola petra TaxID=3075602 RepID=A0ABU2ZQP2_9ALTE|nr:RimK/LysX family protein [Aestuariibacter sp. P117]MDT0594948.1 RimK/LysX family protein [Aestuariibacter sp. P117]
MEYRQRNDKLVLGALEKCDLPELGIFNLVMRVDTGAATSSLHVENVEEYEKNDESWINFDIHPDVYDVEILTRHSCKVEAKRRVKSSTATRERRFVIETLLVIGDQSWPIKMTLTDRSEMTYMMLLGREAMSERVLVDPSKEFLVTA